MTMLKRYAIGSALLIGFGCLPCWLTPRSAAASGGSDRDARMKAAAARGATMKIGAVVESPNLIAVRIRHDMCPYCKGFDSKFVEVVRHANNKSILFVTLDLTSPSSQKQAALLVSAMGIEHLWTGDMSLMGTIRLLDGKSKTTLSSVYQIDVETVQTALSAALKSVLERR